MKKIAFVWNLPNFSSRYKTVAYNRLNSTTLEPPYPFSPIFTTDYESVLAKWQIRLEPDYHGDVFSDKFDPECWDFHLDLVGIQLTSNCLTGVPGAGGAGEPPAKRRLSIVPGVEIKVKCQLFLVEPKIEDGEGQNVKEPFRYLNPAKSYKFSVKKPSAKLGWPEYDQDFDSSDSSVEPSDSDLSSSSDGHGTRAHNEANEILKHITNWVSPAEDSLHVRVHVKLLSMERCADSLNSTLISSLDQALSSGQASDVLIKCGSESFPVHSFILSLRSSVFRTMLQGAPAGTSGDWKEAASGYISIENCEPAVFRLFLQFLYTAKVEFIILKYDQVFGLIAVADKYDVGDLKYFCFQHLLDKRDTRICGQLTVAAYLHRAGKYQKSRIYEFNTVCRNSLAANEEFQALVKAHPAAFLKP